MTAQKKKKAIIINKHLWVIMRTYTTFRPYLLAWCALHYTWIDICASQLMHLYISYSQSYSSSHSTGTLCDCHWPLNLQYIFCSVWKHVSALQLQSFHHPLMLQIKLAQQYQTIDFLAFEPWIIRFPKVEENAATMACSFSHHGWDMLLICHWLLQLA